MINHYFTLIKLIEEFAPKLIGSELIDCFSQEKDSLILNFYDGNNDYIINYTIIENKPIIFINNNFKKAKKNTVNLFPKLINQRLQEIIIHYNNRIIEFHFISNTLIFHIFSPGTSNIFLIDSNNFVIDSFKKRKNYIASTIINQTNNLKKINEFTQDELIFQHLINSELLLTKHYAKALFYRLKLKEGLRFKDLNDLEIKNIFNEAKNIRQKCLKTNKFYVYNYDNSKLLSLIQLNHLTSNFIEFRSINQAIVFKFKFVKRYFSFLQKKKQMLNKFEKKLIKLENKINYISNINSSLERIQNYRKWAEIIMAYPIFKNKKLPNVKLIDFEGNEVQIPLNFKKTVFENANDYFTKAKNNEKELSIRKSLLPKLQEELYITNKILDCIKNSKNLKELENIMNDFKEYDEINDVNNVESKFRIFDLGEGFTLYVGKNAENNDELTMKFAKPNDLWFHARGFGGSHGVLRLNKGQEASKSIIKKAASIIAYYSQARKSKFVPVVYTYRKYVRKPKGANTGTVIISKEEVIMIEPGLPNKS